MRLKRALNERLQKGKKRPIGYVSPGGYKKTAKGWVKVKQQSAQITKKTQSTTAQSDKELQQLTAALELAKRKLATANKHKNIVAYNDTIGQHIAKRRVEGAVADVQLAKEALASYTHKKNISESKNAIKKPKKVGNEVAPSVYTYETTNVAAFASPKKEKLINYVVKETGDSPQEVQSKIKKKGSWFVYEENEDITY